MKYFRRNVVTLAVAIAACGCGGGGGGRSVPTGKVSGEVTFEGKPVATGVVNFEGSGFGGQAPITDGKFSMQDSIPTGSYKVSVTPPPEQPPGPDARPPVDAKDIPAKYRTIKGSDLKAEVKEGSNEFKFDLKP